MSFGFSVGDFVATALLIKDIICSLKASGGATSEFQELIRELDGLQNVLDMIGGLDGTSDPSFVIEGLKIAALNCQFELDGFRTKMKKYEAALGQERSAGKLKEGAMKIKWTLMMKKDVQDLRAYLSGHTSSLNLRLSLAGFSTTVAQGEHMRERQLKMDETLQSIQTALMGVKAGLTVQEAVMQENKSMLWTLVRMVSGDILPQLKRLTDIATKVWSSNMEIVSSVSKLEASMPRPDLRHTWAQDPIRFEDALGRVLPVPSEYDWEKLEAIIMAQFSRGPGHEKVFAGEYELFDNSTVLRKDDFRDTGLLPGMSITMAIIPSLHRQMAERSGVLWLKHPNVPPAYILKLRMLRMVPIVQDTSPSPTPTP